MAKAIRKSGRITRRPETSSQGDTTSKINRNDAETSVVGSTDNLKKSFIRLLLDWRFVFGFLLCFLMEHTILSSSFLNDYYLKSIISTQQFEFTQPTAIATKNNKKSEYKYTRSYLEDYVFTHASQIGLKKILVARRKTLMGQLCNIWYESSVTTPVIHKGLLDFAQSLDEYNNAVQNFSWLQEHNITDIRKHLDEGICDRLELSPVSSSTVTGRDNHGDTTKPDSSIEAFFSPSSSTTTATNNNQSGTVLSYSTHAGYMEPMLPPQRNPQFCFQKDQKSQMDLRYLVHDFAANCRQLKATSRIVIMDLGASPQFGNAVSPWYEITELYRKFGFHADHVYAFEPTHFEPSDIYNGELVPKHMLPSYHWINTGVSIEAGNPLHPWTMLEQEFDEDDFIIVKLDIDTPHLEDPLAEQLAASPKLCKLVDVLYFEHHVFGKTIHFSLDLFLKLREQGVAAHGWV